MLLLAPATAPDERLWNRGIISGLARRDDGALARDALRAADAAHEAVQWEATTEESRDAGDELRQLARELGHSLPPPPQ